MPAAGEGAQHAEGVGFIVGLAQGFVVHGDEGVGGQHHASGMEGGGSQGLAADTLVSVDDAALGKPHDAEDAFRMLKSLSGRWHQVYTGVTVIAADGAVLSETDGTDVHFEAMSDEAIRRYIATGEPMDKAGAYAVQGIAGLWIDELKGSHTNVIGLPMALTRRLLEQAGLL